MSLQLYKITNNRKGTAEELDTVQVIHYFELYDCSEDTVPEEIITQFKDQCDDITSPIGIIPEFSIELIKS